MTRAKTLNSTSWPALTDDRPQWYSIDGQITPSPVVMAPTRPVSRSMTVVQASPLIKRIQEALDEQISIRNTA